MLAVLALCLLAGCQTATVTSERQFTAPVTSRPDIIYVTDFALPPGIIQHEDGVLSELPGPIGRVGDRLSGASTDPAARAQQLVALMSDTLVKELSKAGFNAVKIAAGAPLPPRGWLVRGSFTAVQEGNRLRRSMVGMGQGQTDIQVMTCLDDLSQGTLKPLYEVGTDANSGNKIGAAPTLALGPYGAAIHFVRSGADLDKNVKQTATQIAAQITQCAQQAKPGGPK